LSTTVRGSLVAGLICDITVLCKQAKTREVEKVNGYTSRTEYRPSFYIYNIPFRIFTYRAGWRPRPHVEKEKVRIDIYEVMRDFFYLNLTHDGSGLEGLALAQQISRDGKIGHPTEKVTDMRFVVCFIAGSFGRFKSFGIIQGKTKPEGWVVWTF